MLFLPIPFLTSFIFIVVAGLVFWRLKKRKQKQNYLFLALILIAALQSVLMGLRWGYGIEVFLFLSPILAACVPPLIYRLVLGLVGVDLIQSFRVWLHAVAPMLVAALLLVAPSGIDPLLIVIFITYAAIILNMMRLGTNSLQLVSLEGAGMAYAWIMFAAISLLFSAMIDCVIFFEFLTLSDDAAIIFIMFANVFSLLSIAVAALGITAYQTEMDPARLVQNVAPTSQAGLDAHTALTQEEHEETLAAIEELLVSKRLYRDVNLNLDRLGRRLGLPARKVSSAINQLRAQNVSQFVNEFRIMEACELLLKTNQSVTDIMFNVGFQTKSNFNREFRRVTGKTPLNWRNQI